MIHRKVSILSINGIGGGGGLGGVLRPQGFRGQSTLRKFLGSKEHLDWLKIDLNVAETITVQDYKHKEN